MYEPDVCPVCGEEYESAQELDPHVTLMSKYESEFCVMANEVRMLAYVHYGNLTDKSEVLPES